ncbi:MAG: putative ATPase, family [Hydrocarboniphaga sp.]|uniref:ATP-binding protein n=1 Tax=Hydrocarboniphaga sp. TaxID=2033016 RepID=UPI002618DEF3|nr:ATP-binding protein [Hydrocarboniphaga sp.]MDB5970546.1 putative ATPase, family [Hydrocarboniphaga sp.]
MNAPQPLDWSDANQRLLAAEFARLKRQLAGDDAADALAGLQAAQAALSAPAAIDTLAQAFGLSAFERDLLLLCAGVEMDAELAALCASTKTSPRGGASFGLALAVLADPHWSALTPARPLRRWRLLEPADEASIAAARLRIDERVLHYLAGINYLDPRLQPLLQPLPLAQLMAPAHQRLCASITQALAAPAARSPILQLSGDDPHAQQDIAAHIAAQWSLQLHALNTDDIPANLLEAEALIVLWEREAALLDSALLIECGEAAISAAARRFIERVGGVAFVATRERLKLRRSDLHFTVNKPERLDQKQLWTQALGAGAARLNGTLDGVAAQFRLSARTIAQTAAELPNDHTADMAPDALWQACRSSEHTRLNELAQRIEPAAGWDDLVLPEPQKNTLKQIAAHVRHRLTVYEQWGFAGKGARGLGISVLFAGESGTGKTMAAEVLAKELHLDLYRIDLASVVSKYIGETEKNLRRVFDAAEDSGAILLFDEADALFGKRSEVKDSHDRYANIEVSYLLQRMEAHRGLSILTTNLKTALDTAFQRRLRFVVQFPFPDAPQRETLWRGIFPAATPLAALDYAKLARLSAAGGSIRNIALNAAFNAAEAHEAVSMKHLLQATHAEASKRERPLSDAETRGWV